ncbi:hypothetical protein KI387_042168, partial [Taxus chinensis]
QAGRKRKRREEEISESGGDNRRVCWGAGYAQVIHVFLVSLAWFFDSQHTLVTIFTDAQASVRCESETSGECASSLMCDMDKRGRTSWEWVGGKGTSIIAEWDLVCEDKVTYSWTVSGFTFGEKEDVDGVVRADGNIGSPHSTFSKHWIYSVLRFASGFWRSGIGVSCLVLSTEAVGSQVERAGRAIRLLLVFGRIRCTARHGLPHSLLLARHLRFHLHTPAALLSCRAPIHFRVPKVAGHQRTKPGSFGDPVKDGARKWQAFAPRFGDMYGCISRQGGRVRKEAVVSRLVSQEDDTGHARGFGDWIRLLRHSTQRPKSEFQFISDGGGECGDGNPCGVSWIPSS